MHLIAKYLEKDSENAEIEPSTFEAQTSRLERFRGVGRGAAGLRCSPFFLGFQKNPKGTPLAKLKFGSKNASWQPFLSLAALSKKSWLRH